MPVALSTSSCGCSCGCLQMPALTPREISRNDGRRDEAFRRGIAPKIARRSSILSGRIVGVYAGEREVRPPPGRSHVGFRPVGSCADSPDLAHSWCTVLCHSFTAELLSSWTLQ
jgi:hypothetical protein